MTEGAVRISRTNVLSTHSPCNYQLPLSNKEINDPS